MKTKFHKATCLCEKLLLTLIMLAISGTLRVEAQSFGIHFLGVATGSPVTGQAGVVPISGWNNINNSGLTAGVYGNFPITSDNGSLSATLSLGGYANFQSWYNPQITQDNANGSLLSGYIDTGLTGASPSGAPDNSAKVVISGLTDTSYNVFIYCAGDNPRPGDDQGTGFIEGLPSYAVNGVTNYTATAHPTGAFSGFVQGTITNVNLSKDLNSNDSLGLTYGNYIVISNVFAESGTIRVTANADNNSWRSPLNGIELVPTTSSAAPTLVWQTPSLTNFAGTTIQLLVGATGTPLHFQWMAGAVGSGVYTNLINGGNISGVNSSTLTISNSVSGNQADYIIIITNSLGSVTSSVPITVSILSLTLNDVFPNNEVLYPGATATFRVSASGSQLSYQWQKISGGTTNNITGATNSTLNIANVGSGNVAFYQVIVSTPYATAIGGPVSLALTAAPIDLYGQDIMALKPVAYWRFDEGSPATDALDFAGGHNAIYGNDAYQQNEPGPIGPGLPTPDYAINCQTLDSSSYATLPAIGGIGLNTNVVTIVAWVNPYQLAPNSGIVFQRDSSGIAGFGLNGSGHLGYNWNDNASTWSWDSDLVLPLNQWSMVALVVTPTNTSLYVLSAGSQLSAVTPIANAATPFSGAVEIGSDSQDNVGRVFGGDIDEVSIFNRALTGNQIASLYTDGAGTPVPPSISQQPQSQWAVAGTNVQFNVAASGTAPLTYQWQQDIGSGFQDIVGATNTSLILSNVGPSVAGSYLALVKNPVATNSSDVATLTILMPTGFQTNITALSPYAYWPLNETSGTNALDYSGHGLHGLYEPGVTMDNAGPNPPFTFDPANNVSAVFSGAANSYVSLPPLNLNSANVTFTEWIYPTASTQSGSSGLFFWRDNGGHSSGLCYANNGLDLSYGWNDDSQLWSYDSGLNPPQNQWSFVALVVTPTNATFYLYNTNSQVRQINVHNHAPAEFSSETRIGDDNNGQTRRFQGNITQVAVFTSSLSSHQIGSIYAGGGGVPPVSPSDANLTIQHGGSSIQLQWAQGTLLEATNLAGPWITNMATSPYSPPTSAPQKFYRVKLQ